MTKQTVKTVVVTVVVMILLASAAYLINGYTKLKSVVDADHSTLSQVVSFLNQAAANSKTK